MEMAYAELYREFLRLRSLCLKQAALLQQLSSALQGSVATGNRGGSDAVTRAVQCRHMQQPPPPPPPADDSKPPCGCTGNHTHTVTTADMEKLCVGVARQVRGGGAVAHSTPPSSAPLLTDRPTPQTCQTPWEFNPFLDDDPLSQAGGVFMSELAMQSNVCNFCEAVFPGDTTTRGQFLQHLHTHLP